MKVKKLIAVALAVVLVVVLGAGVALAKPQGDTRDADVGHMLYKFNVIATPNDWSADDTTCPNSGHRIFFKRVDSGKIGDIQWTLDPLASGFTITDCDGTSDKTAAIVADEKINFYVFVRVHGKKNSSLDLYCTETTDDVNDNDLCEIDYVRLNKGKSFTKIMSNIFDDALEGVLWELYKVNGKEFRIAEVRIYEKL